MTSGTITGGLAAVVVSAAALALPAAAQNFQQGQGQGQGQGTGQPQGQQQMMFGQQLPPGTSVIVVPQQQVDPGFHDPHSRMTITEEPYGQTARNQGTVVPVPTDQLRQPQQRQQLAQGLVMLGEQLPPGTTVLLVPQQQVAPGFHDPHSRMTTTQEPYPQSTGTRVLVLPVPMDQLGRFQQQQQAETPPPGQGQGVQ